MTTSLRKMSRRFTIPAIVLLIALGGATGGAAEPIDVTGGFFQVHIRIPEGFFSLEGENFSFTGGYDAVFGSFSLVCDFCAPGTAVELDSAFRMQQGRGRAVVDGITYPEIWFEGDLAFDVPTAQITGSESKSLIVPFAFRGLVEFFAIDPFIEPSDPIFSTALAGRGRAIAQFFYRADIDAFDALPEIRYEFDAADPVPEPATLLLCGSGVAALGMIRKRRSRVKT